MSRVDTLKLPQTLVSCLWATDYSNSQPRLNSAVKLIFFGSFYSVNLEMMHFDEHMFAKGVWFNHHLAAKLIQKRCGRVGIEVDKFNHVYYTLTLDGKASVWQHKPWLLYIYI